MKEGEKGDDEREQVYIYLFKRKEGGNKCLGGDLRWAKNPHKYKLNLRIPYKEAMRYTMQNACSMIVRAH